MDPNEVLAELRRAIAAGDADTAMEAADLLDGWLTAGGFLPRPWARVQGKGEECGECEHVVPPGATVHPDHGQACSLAPANVVG